MVSIKEQKAQATEKRMTKQFLIIVSVFSALIVAESAAMAIHAFTVEGWNAFTVIGGIFVIATLVISLPVIIKTLKTGRITTP